MSESELLLLLRRRRRRRRVSERPAGFGVGIGALVRCSVSLLAVPCPAVLCAPADRATPRELPAGELKDFVDAADTALIVSFGSQARVAQTVVDKMAEGARANGTHLYVCMCVCVCVCVCVSLRLSVSVLSVSVLSVSLCLSLYRSVSCPYALYAPRSLAICLPPFLPVCLRDGAGLEAR